MRELQKKAAALDRKLKQADAALRAAAGLAIALRRDMEAGLATIEASFAKLRAIPAGLAVTPSILVERYIAERIAPAPDASVQARALYRDFELWCGAVGHQPISQRSFGELMGAKRL